MQFGQLEEYFPPRVRERARDYERAIRVLEQTEDHLHVHIRGADDYCVQLERFDDAIGASCTCPYFDGSGPCKHVWAGLLHAERLGAFPGDPSPGDLVRLAVVPHARISNRKKAPEERTASAWRHALRVVDQPTVDAPLPPGGELAYVIDLDASLGAAGVHLDIGVRTQKRSGDLSLPRAATFERSAIEALADPLDREIMALVAALSGGRYGYGVASRVTLPDGLAQHVLARAASTGRLSVRLPDRDLSVLRLDDGAAYALHLVVEPELDAFVLRGELRRDGDVIPLSTPLLVSEGGIVVFPDRIARIEGPGSRWIGVLRDHGGKLRVPIEEGLEFALELATLPSVPTYELPVALRIDEKRGAPVPRLSVAILGRGLVELSTLVLFVYDDVLVGEHDTRERIVVEGSLLVRDRVAEATFLATLRALGLRQDDRVWSLPASRFSDVVAALALQGWQVEVGGKGVQTPGPIDVAVRSSIDWFDLSAEVQYGQERIALPSLLAAARRGERYITLADGTIGLLPDAWLVEHRLLGELGAAHGDELRFKKGQLGLLDALLATLPEAQIDEQLARARASLARFSKITPAEPPASFVGTLRAYQHEGLGWLEFLREFGFGGCLADDMGLGKTIQVLALLDSRRSGKKPSLVVVPKSLLFNWQREAAQFTPELRVLEHHGPKRSLERVSDYDLVVTTYGTLVRDAAALQSIAFDYAILDEAQAIKNARTDAAKAARLLRCDHRLALTGTPIENRLSDLWSLFEFLNPGMLGASAVWKRFAQRSPEETLDDAEERSTLARALRPFLLRRTKEQVAHDLPPKTEQIIYCELEGEERAQYDDLRAHYRSSLLGLVADKGVERSQMHILEALLRLRQAACHPALIDPARAEQPSAKLSALLGQLEEVVEGGHKAVVFSQFTSLLAVVRRHLDKAGLAYAYLDGKTRDRKARVDQFQNDPQTPIFLVSLKAGGVGLNLTAAEYVFLLDPWWNPAVEAQAIDRAHRIGQTKPVIAYRLIGRDTIEEKVLTLQAQKRALASAVIDAEHAVIGAIGKEELELLLS